MSSNPNKRPHPEGNSPDNENPSIEGSDEDRDRLKIRRTQSNTFHAMDSSLSVQNSSALRVNVVDSKLGVTDSSNLLVSGKRNEVKAARVVTGLVTGDDNNIFTESVTDFTMSGCRTLCHLANEQRTSIYGNDNTVIGLKNINMLVCGGGNCIMAQENRNLKVRGVNGTVKATRTSYITVDGPLNDVTVQDTAVRHVISRVQEGWKKVHHVTFGGDPMACHAYSGIAFPTSEEAFTIENKDGSSSKIWPCHDQIIVPISFLEDNQAIDNFNPVNVMIPHVDIKYINRASINRNNYILGIFHFEVESVTKSTGYSNLLKVTVSRNNLDSGTFKAILTIEKKTVVIMGKENGLQEMLKLSAPSFKKCKNAAGEEIPNVFVADLEPESSDE